MDASRSTQSVKRSFAPYTNGNLSEASLWRSYLPRSAFTFARVRPAACTHDITIDDYGTLATIRELAVSLDGKFVAYNEYPPVGTSVDDLSKTDLWVVATDGKGKPTRLTGDRANDRHPKWSLDGKAIYVLGNRKREAETKPPYDGNTQVWMCAPPLAATRQRSQRSKAVSLASTTSPKADALFYSVDNHATDNDEFTAVRSKFKLEYGHGKRKVSEVYRLDLQSWRTEKVIADGRYIREFAVTQDGTARRGDLVH